DAIRQARIDNANSSNYNSSSFQQADTQFASSQGSGGGGRGAASSQQFLGDLTADSPIPFSIPINGLNLLKPGNYAVSFKVVYADDLKNFHTLILTQNVMVAKSPTTHTRTQGSIIDQILGDPLLLTAVGVSIAGAIAAAIIIRKRKTRKKLKMLTGDDKDIVAVLENVDKEQNESK
ncbi:MAG: hypothetical protein KGI08_10795, partial [Thaumarchaeota archaeon]|nr:hypothetical protein [Nitrososphaerota archaeon]